MKRVLSLTLSLLLVMGALFMFPASAETELNTEDGMYRYKVVGDYVELTRCVNPDNAPLNSDGFYTIPSEIDGKPVKVLGKNLYRSSGLPSTKIIIPNSVEEIGKQAFNTNQNSYPKNDDKTLLTDVVIPKSVKTIGDRAFADCKIESVSLPEGLETIGGGAFKNTNIKSLVIPKSVTSIGASAFYNSYVKTVEIKAPLKRIENSTFASCGNLESVKLPNTLEEIGAYAFEESYLPEIELPKSVRRIENEAFYETWLRKAVINENTYVGTNALGEDEYEGVYNFRQYVRYAEGNNKNYHKNLAKILRSFDSDYHRYPCTYIIPNKNHNYLFKYIGTLRLKVDGNKAKNWKSSNPDIFRITKDGVLTIFGKGKATITATLPNGKKFKSVFKNYKSVSLKRFYSVDDLFGSTDQYSYAMPKTLEIPKGETAEVELCNLYWFNKNYRVKNSYKNTPYAKVIGKAYNAVVTIKGIKKGTSFVKICFNNQTLKQRVRVV